MDNKIPQIYDLEDLAKKKGMLVEEYARLLIQYNTLTSQELAEELGVSQSRVAALKKSGKIQEIKKGIFLAIDAANMRVNQLESDSMKHSVSNEYHILPTRYSLSTKDDKRVLFISKTRFSDCLVMADRGTDPGEYVKELNKLFSEMIQILKEDGVIFPLNEQDFRKFKNNEIITFEELNAYKKEPSYMFNSNIGLSPQELFNWIVRCKITLKKPNVIKELDLFMENISPLINEELEKILKSTYHFSDIRLTKSTELSLYFEFKTNQDINGELKVIKATRRIAFNQNGQWLVDKKHMLTKDILF